jgi:hypothetical protein
VATVWAFGLVLWVVLHATLLVDVMTFTRVAALFDRPGLAWLEAALGYLCVIVVASKILDSGVASAQKSVESLLSLLAFAGYTYHLFLLRWPWLVGVADAHCRLTLWGAVLSTTHHGMPLLAFGELLSLALVLTHAYVGLSGTARWQGFMAKPGRGRIIVVGVGLIGYLLASAVVIALATGRR